MRTKSEHDRLCATADGRQKLASELRELITKNHPKATIETTVISHERCVTVYIKTGPYRVLVEFNGRLKLQGFLAHWHMAGLDQQVTYPRNFIGGSVNKSHSQKATGWHENWETFKVVLDRALTQLETLKEAA